DQPDRQQHAEDVGEEGREEAILIGQRRVLDPLHPALGIGDVDQHAFDMGLLDGIDPAHPHRVVEPPAGAVEQSVGNIGQEIISDGDDHVPHEQDGERPPHFGNDLPQARGGINDHRLFSADGGSDLTHQPPEGAWQSVARRTISRRRARDRASPATP
nr:hypothetical protein [Tanacetum cinerariifolium]